MNRGEYLRTWSALHGFAADSEVQGIARAYLAVNYSLVKPLVLMKFTPNLVTLFAPALALLALFTENTLLVALLILGSLMVDGFDGAVAIIRGKTSAMGGAWDGIVDRVTEPLVFAVKNRGVRIEKSPRPGHGVLTDDRVGGPVRPEHGRA